MHWIHVALCRPWCAPPKTIIIQDHCTRLPPPSFPSAIPLSWTNRINISSIYTIVIVYERVYVQKVCYRWFGMVRGKREQALGFLDANQRSRYNRIVFIYIYDACSGSLTIVPAMTLGRGCDYGLCVCVNICAQVCALRFAKHRRPKRIQGNAHGRSSIELLCCAARLWRNLFLLDENRLWSPPPVLTAPLCGLQ